MLKRFWKGLRAIEIAVLLALVAILIAIIFSRYENFACRSMQSEAKFFLQEILNAQMLYHAKQDKFAPLAQLIAQERLELANKYYDFSDDQKPGQDNFTVRAIGKAHTLVAGDLWLINEKKELKHSKSVCAKP